MSMVKCCLNWKVLVGLGVIAAGILVFQPDLFWRALPTLAVLLCPLSMGLMMFGMGKMGDTRGTANQGTQQRQQYTCPMHPDVRADRPGSCPKCGMALAPVAPSKPAREATRAATGPELSRERELAQLRGELRQVSEQQAALQRRLEELGVEQKVPSNKAVREAEQVARAADRRR